MIKETYPKKYAKILKDYIVNERPAMYIKNEFEHMEKQRQLLLDQELTRKSGRAEVNGSGYESGDDHVDSDEYYEPKLNLPPKYDKFNGDY